MDRLAEEVTPGASRDGSDSLVSLATALTLVLLAEAGDELPDAEVLDHGLENLVVAAFDLVDLDLGLLGDEVHSALSFLL